MYSCEQCAGTGRKCSECQARRAAADRARREKYRQLDLCILCGGAVIVPGAARCERHTLVNAQHSTASHSRRRARSQ